MTRYLHTMYRITDPARSRAFYEALGFESDFAWGDHGLVVEVDGFAFHRTRGAFERDRARDAVLAAAGVRTLRFTARQVERRPVEVVAALRAAQGRSISSTR